MNIIFALLCLVATASQAGAWGEDGHRGIAEAVQDHLQASTVNAIAKIVGAGNDLPPGTLARLAGSDSCADEEPACHDSRIFPG